MRLNKKFSTLIAVAAITTMAMPVMALAHDDDRNETRSREVNESRHDIDDDKGLHLGIPGIFYKGNVTAVSSTGFTMNTRENTSLTVEAGSAKIIRVPRTVITLTDIKVNDKVWVTGTKTGSTVAASVIYTMSENVRPGKAKGTVTAVSGNTITLQTKNDKTITVNTTAETDVVKADGTTGTTTDIQVGSKLKIWGLWDKITNILSALRIHIR